MFHSLCSIDRPLGSGSAISLSSVGESLIIWGRVTTYSLSVFLLSKLHAPSQ